MSTEESNRPRPMKPPPEEPSSIRASWIIFAVLTLFLPFALFASIRGKKSMSDMSTFGMASASNTASVARPVASVSPSSSASAQPVNSASKP